MADLVRLYLWSLGDAKTSLEELRRRVPRATPPDFWLLNEASERFGLVTFGDTPRDTLEHVRDLIGKEPEVAEEFDVLE